MRTLVVGCGSVGARRARILAEMGHEVMCYDANIVSAVRLARSLGAPAKASIGGNVWTGTGDGYDAVFICTPADTHVRVAFDCIQAPQHPRGIFVEKPLSSSLDGVDELASVCETLDIVTMGACNMRWGYRNIPRIRPPNEMALLTSGPLSGWRPGAETYRTHGIILESAIHDLDLATYFLGPVEGLTVSEASDGYVDLRTHHPAGRTARIVNDWTESAVVARGVTVPEHRDDPKALAWTTYKPDTSDAMYREEMAEFLHAVEMGNPALVGNSLREAAQVLRWALIAKEQAEGVRA